ncbi:hypothetical protein SLS62_003049 [Diatrype stigma]|uniref:Subtilisin n=1 Tax=Diatrype stigma TaxID=117547 RepID=A0AAN9UTJ0_9PEZI
MSNITVDRMIVYCHMSSAKAVGEELDRPELMQRSVGTNPACPQCETQGNLAMRISHAAIFYSGALLGTAVTALGNTPVGPQADGTLAETQAAPEFVPGAYIVELDDVDDDDDQGGIPQSFYRSLADEDGIEVEHRMDLSSSRLFRGASFQVLQNSTATAAAAATGPDEHKRNLEEDQQQQRTKILAAAKAKPRVKNVWPVRIVKFKESLKLANSNSQSAKAPVFNTRRTAETTGSKRQGDGRDDDETAEDTFSPHVITQVDKLRAEGITGKGIRIAIVDSGVDWKHPALGGCFGAGAGCVVEAGYDFTGDDFLPGSNDPQPDGDPYDDCVGHGTHVAGIIAAQPLQEGDGGLNFSFTGAAPGAKLAVYRAWGCRATSTTEILIAAFNRAFEDGADVISCSDGDSSGWADDAWGLVASRIVEAGVPVVISEGNDGSSGLFLPSTPATGRGVTGVGASTNTLFPVLFTAATYSVGGDNASLTKEEEFGFLQGSPPFPAAVKLPLWPAGNSTAPTDDDACSPLPDDTPDLSDKIVLLGVPSNSNCYPIDQGTNVAAKGGRYMMYYAQDNLTLDEEYVYADGIEGVAMVAPYQGARWLDLLLNQGETVTVAMPNNPNATTTRLEQLENTVSGGYMADFTSWGPTWELEATPQLSAPGANILSTFLLNQGGYRVMSGTSMLASIYALMAEARGGTMDPALFRRLLTATSKPQTWFDRVTAHEGVIAPVPQQGGGIVQAYDAAHATAVLTVDGVHVDDGAAIISFNDSDHFVGEHTFSIQNTGAADLVFELGHVKAPTMYTFIPGADVLRASAFPNPIVEGVAAELSFSSDTVTVPAGGSTNVTVTGVPPSTDTGLNATLLPVYSGYITLTSSDSNATTLRLPYLGVVGSLKSTPALQPARVYLADYNLPVEANRTYTLPRPDPAATPPRDDQSAQPNVLADLTVGTRMLRVDVVQIGSNGTGTTLGSLPGYPLPFAPRDEKRAYFKGLLADKTVLSAGTYKLLVSALRVFGDAEKPEDWDVLETVPFNVKYE